MRIIYTQRYEEITTVVVETLEKAGVRHLPVSPFEIADRLGIKVRKYSEAGPEKREYLLSLQKDGFSFKYTKDLFEFPVFIIWYNDDMLEERIRWTIAHEIGHITLGHLEESELAEAEANFFAGTLLAAPVIIKMLKLTTLSDVQNTLVLSNEATIHAVTRYNNRFAHGHSLTDNESKMCRLFNAITSNVSGGDAMK